MTQYPPSEAISVLVRVLFQLKIQDSHRPAHGGSEGRGQVYQNIHENNGILGRVRSHSPWNLECDFGSERVQGISPLNAE